MRVRSLIAADIPALKAMQREYPYPDLEMPLEAVRVVVDDEDKPLMAVGAKRLAELYLWCGPIQKPHAKMYALRLLHEDMSVILRDLGYHGAEAFLPPPVAKRFARRLEKSFGWTRNWLSWSKGL